MAKLGVVHAIFHCDGCSMTWEDYGSAQRQAQEHTRRTGHTTRGEVGTAFEYRRTEPMERDHA